MDDVDGVLMPHWEVCGKGPRTDPAIRIEACYEGWTECDDSEEWLSHGKGPKAN